MKNDHAAQTLMLNALAAQGKGADIQTTHRKLIEDGQQQQP